MEALTINAMGRVRREKLDGRDFFVATITSIVPGVLNGSQGPILYEERDISTNVSSWDELPITLDHPYANGQYISVFDARHDVRRNLGFVRNSKYTGKLVHEGWFDIEKIKKADQLFSTNLYEKLATNQQIEMSTGLYMDREDANSNAVYNGRNYRWIARNYNPNHIAALPHKVGACSIRDGCGINVNESVDSDKSIETEVSNNSLLTRFIDWLTNNTSYQPRNPITGHWQGKVKNAAKKAFESHIAGQPQNSTTVRVVGSAIEDDTNEGTNDSENVSTEGTSTETSSTAAVAVANKDHPVYNNGFESDEQREAFFGHLASVSSGKDSEKDTSVKPKETDKKSSKQTKKHKDVRSLSASAINKELDKNSEDSSKVVDEFIAAGRGHETPLDYANKTDDLSSRANAIAARRRELVSEVELRAGPGMRRLPRGFGPRNVNNSANKEHPVYNSGFESDEQREAFFGHLARVSGGKEGEKGEGGTTSSDSKTVQEQKSDTHQPWHGGKEENFAAMRRLGQYTESYHKRAKEYGPRSGSISVGSADYDYTLKATAGDAYLRKLRQGGTPNEAYEHAKTEATESVKKWNATGHKSRASINSPNELKRWEGAGEAAAFHFHTLFKGMVGNVAKQQASNTSISGTNTMTREQKIKILTANCNCDEDKAVFNLLSDNAIDVQYKYVTANKKDCGASGEKTAPAVEGEEEEDDEEAVMNSSVPLAKRLTPEELEVWNYVANRAAADRKQYTDVIVNAHSTDKAKRAAFRKKLAAIDMETLQSLAAMQSKRIATNVETESVNEVPLYGTSFPSNFAVGGPVGNQGNEGTYQVETEDPFADAPTLNFENPLDAYYKRVGRGVRTA